MRTDKTILITNDDGYESEGLKALVEAMRTVARVIVAAPATEKSACAHSLTLTRPMRFVEVDDDFYKLDDGTPTDCVFLALNAYFCEKEKPDLVISGINRGSNMGEDITYSGTVAGAMEGVLLGVPSIAISQVCKDKCQNIFDFGYDLAAEVAKELAIKVLDGAFPLGERKLINVNVPPIKKSEFKGYKVTKAGYRVYANSAHLHRNPRGEEYYWIGLPALEWIPSSGAQICDLSAIDDGYVSITPVHLDLTSYEDIKTLEDWL
ncbi:MAG: 5'/3'-nucleotidase SurE [Epsilonproteobacteria bacterium]|nr:5'/3'-nucleotidase SurE [Campylobacterota bacterium]